MKIIAQFLKSPGSPLDTSCTSQVLPPSFSRPSDEIDFFLGTSELWFGAPRVAATRELPDVFRRVPRIATLPLPY
jgi:hypothetical protein